MTTLSKKKIVIATGIFPPDIGGPASYGKLMAEQLSHDYTVQVVTYGAPEKNADKKYTISSVSRSWPKGFRHLLFFLKLWSAARNADIIFVLNAVSAGRPAATCARLLKKKLIVKIVGDYAWEQAIGRGQTNLLINDFQKLKKTGLIGRLHRWQVETCQRADGIIVPSRYLAGIVAGWGISEEKIKVIYNGVDFEPSLLSKEDARKQVGILGHVILSYGRLVPWKGFRMLIKLMPQISTINQAFRLVIVGDGPDYKTLETMVKNLGLERKVILAGKKNKSEVATYLAAADMVVLNTGYEGFSHQLLETMAAGVPIITTTVAGNREIIHQGENGFMVKYNDEFNLLEAIRMLWDHPEVAQECIAGGRETIKKFSLEKMYTMTEALFKEFL